MAHRHYFFLLAIAICPVATTAAATDEQVLPSSIEAEASGLPSWADRVESLSNEMQAGEKMSDDADVMYLELHEIWLERQKQLQEVLGRVHSPSDPISVQTKPLAEGPERLTDAEPIQEFDTVRDLYDELINLYQVRLQLLELITPSLHAEITGLDRYGVQELKAELNFIIEVIRFQGLGSEFMQRLRSAPFLLIYQFILCVLAVVIFRWWRSWLPITLSRMRAAMMEFRPRSPAVVRRLKLLWYIDQTRSPLEWLILFLVVSSVFHVEGLHFEEDLLRIVLQGVLLGWFAVTLTNAFVARGQRDLTGPVAKVRLRSFRLLTVWLVFLVLGLRITAILAGTATMYAWVWLVFKMLSVPVFVVLLVWWRPEIFRRLSIHPERTEIVERRIKNKTGLRSIVNAIYGVSFLLASWLRRFLLRQVARFGTTNILDANATYDRGMWESAVKDEKRSPIDGSTRQLFLAQTRPYQKYMKAELRALTIRAKDKRGGVIAVIGERGSGKSVFLQRLASELKGQMLILKCGSGGFPELVQSLAEALDCGTAPVDPGQMSKQLEKKDIRVVAFDNGHYLMRPVIGGQQELEQLADFAKNITGKVIWLTAFDLYAAQLAFRIRAGTMMTDDLFQLPPWTHEQLSDLIDQRCEDAGIDPDFENLTIPSEYLETTHETTKGRNRAAVYRMLSSISEGNPTVAMQCWLDCLRLDKESGRPVVSLPSRRTDRGLVAAETEHEMLLVLRVLAQSELVSLDDIAENIGIPTRAVTAKLHRAMSHGWVEKAEDRYRLSWTWFRPITQALVRRNLLAH